MFWGELEKGEGPVLLMKEDLGVKESVLQVSQAPATVTALLSKAVATKSPTLANCR